jgi:hypothetical protein
LPGAGDDGSAITFSGATFADGADSAGGRAPVAVHGTETLTALPVVGTFGNYFCLVARSGGAAVAGATWTFTVSVNLMLTDEETLAPLTPSCVLVTGTRAGAATLTATASGFTKTFAFTAPLLMHARHTVAS